MPALADLPLLLDLDDEDLDDEEDDLLAGDVYFFEIQPVTPL